MENILCMKVYKENHIATTINNDYSYSWETKYIGRKIIREEYDVLFDHNGHYPYVQKYEDAGIILNINPIVDSDGYIEDISWYKVKDLTEGHGRPVTEEKDLNKSDIKLCEKILDSVTEDYVEQEYLDLVEKLSNSQSDLHEYKLLKATNKALIFIDQSNKEIAIDKKTVKTGLYLSHQYLEVLNNQEALHFFPDVFKEEQLSLLFNIFSNVDTSHYRNVDQLKIEADEKELCRKAVPILGELLIATKENDISRVAELSKYAKYELPDVEETPLFEAVKNGNTEIVTILVNNGANTNDGVSLKWAVEHENGTIIKLLAEHSAVVYGISRKVAEILKQKEDLDTLFLLLSNVTEPVGYNAFEFNPLPYSYANAKRFVECETAWIKWPIEYIEEAYATDQTLCERLLVQGSTKEVIDFLISEKNYKLTDICLDRHPNVEPRASFGKTFLWDPKWFEMLKSHTAPAYNYSAMNNYLARYLGEVIKLGKYNEYVAIVDNLECGIPLDSLMNGFVNFVNAEDDSDLDNFFTYILDNIVYKQDIKGGVSSNDTGFHFFSEAIYKYANIEICKRCLNKYPLGFMMDFKEFTGIMRKTIIERDDDFYQYCIRYSIDNEKDDYSQKMFGLFQLLIKWRNENLREWPFDNEEKIAQKRGNVERCKAAIIYLIKYVSPESLEKGMMVDEYEHSDSPTLSKYVQSLVDDKEILDLI